VVDSRGESALHAAVAAGSLPKLSLLLRLGVPVDARDVDGETALHRAVRAGANEAAARLIRAGADLFAGNNADVMPIDLAFNRGPVELDEFLTPNRARARSDRGETVLIRAVQTDRSPDIIRVIIEAGAPIEARTARGATALHLAVAMRDPEAIELLLRANASIYVRDNAGESPLLTAVRDGVESLRALDVGGTLAERDAEENTSLHVAAREGSVETVEYLLDRGINPNSRNLVGQTPVDVAREAGNAQIARVLEAAR
jgi:ankyrin repeat protein